MFNSSTRGNIFKIIKRLFSLTIALCFAVQMFVTPEVLKAATSDMPILKIVDNKTFTATAGEILQLNLTIMNTSSYSARDIWIKPNLEEDSPFTPTSKGYAVLDSLLSGANTVISFSFSVSPYAEEKLYSLEFDFEYSSYTGDYFGSGTAPSDKIYIKVENPNRLPRFNVEATSSLANIEGSSANIINTKLNIRNTGNLPARDIKVSLQGLKDDGLLLYQDSNLRNIPRIDGGGNAIVSYSLLPSSKMEAGLYGLVAKLEYKDQTGKDYVDEFNFFVEVTEGIKNTNPHFNLVATSNLAEKEDAPAALINTKLKLTNLGNLPARDVKVSLKGLKDDGLGLYQDSNLKSISSIDGYGEVTVNYALLPSSKMEKGNYGLIAEVTYKDQSGKEYSEEFQFFVEVVRTQKESNQKSVPRVILKEYSSEPTIVKAGENFILNLAFYNTSSTKTVTNIKVSFTVPEGGTNNSSGSVFSPVNTSNTIYIDSIPPKGVYHEVLEYYTIPDATPKTYTLTANFEYEDENGESYEAKELIGIPVSQQLKLETSELVVPSEVFTGEPVAISVDFYNTGKAKLSNLMFKIEGDFEIQNASYYVGNFDVGSSDYFEGTVIPNTPGIHEGALVITYEDTSGEIIEVRKPFTINAMEMPMPEMPSDFDQGGMTPKGSSKTIWWIGGGLLAVIILLLVLIKKGIFKKLIGRKKGLTLDE